MQKRKVFLLTGMAAGMPPSARNLRFLASTVPFHFCPRIGEHINDRDVFLQTVDYAIQGVLSSQSLPSVIVKPLRLPAAVWMQT